MKYKILFPILLSFLSIFLFKVKEVYADCVSNPGSCVCNVGPACYTDNKKLECCTGNGTGCSGDCTFNSCASLSLPGTCQSIDNYTFDGNACQRLSVFECAINVIDGCMNNSGQTINTQCHAYPIGTPPPPSCTSDGTCLPGGGSCCSGNSYSNSACGSGTMCGTSGGGGTCYRCHPGGAFCESYTPSGSCTTNCNGGCGGGGGSNSQGAYAYCQDGNGPVYPLPGLNISVDQKEIAAPYTDIGNTTKITGSDGKTFFGNLNSGYGYTAGIAGVPYYPANIPGHPLFAYAGTKILGTGQDYSQLVFSTQNSSMIVDTSCHTSAWTFTSCGPSWGFTCGTFCTPNNGSTNGPWPDSDSTQYHFEVPSYGEAQYNMVWHFSNCTPPPPPSFWQIIGGDVISNGSLLSSVPPGQRFLLDGSWGLPGNAIFGGTLNTGSGSISSKNWNAGSSYKGKTYNYQYFYNLTQQGSNSSIVWNNLPGVVAQSNIDTGSSSSDGYAYFKSVGDVTVNSNIKINGTEKVVFFVNGNLNINGNINLNKAGTNFFLAAVSGNINVGSTVTSVSPAPSIEGIYEIDGTFDTGPGSNNFYVKGTVVAGAMNIRRGTLNQSDPPSETFQYDPILTLLFPRSLTQDGVNWTEVAP